MILHWFYSNISTIIVSIVLICMVVLAVIYLVKSHKKGGCPGCSDHCGCSDCPHNQNKNH
jgi:hypothetical protein